MGAAIECFAGAEAICVPRDRFAPVKTTNDLLRLWSDAYEVSEPVFENLPFLERVGENFERLSVEGLVRIDADRREDEIAADVDAAIDALLERLA